MQPLTVREKAIKLAFEVPEDILRQTVEEWEATMEVLNDAELMEAIEQGEREIKSGNFSRLEDVQQRLFGE